MSDTTNEPIIQYGNAPLLEIRELSITSSKWQTVLKWDGEPDKIFYVDTFIITAEYMPLVTGSCSVRIKSDGEVIAEINNNAIDDEPALFWYSMKPTQFKGNNPKGHLVFEAKADDVNAILATAEILGIQIDKKKEVQP